MPAALATPRLLDASGWLSGVRQCRSPNFGPRPPGTTVDLAVVHSISLPPGIYGGDAIEALFTNRLDWDADPYYQQIRGIEVSAHFVIRRDGEVVQFVSTHHRAWHAGRSSWQGRDNCNDYSIGIELEGLEGHPFDAPQYTALADVLVALARQLPLRTVAGHEHVAPGRKQDPGTGFEWRRLIGMLGWPAPYFPEAVRTSR